MFDELYLHGLPNTIGAAGEQICIEFFAMDKQLRSNTSDDVFDEYVNAWHFAKQFLMTTGVSMDMNVRIEPANKSGTLNDIRAAFDRLRLNLDSLI